MLEELSGFLRSVTPDRRKKVLSVFSVLCGEMKKATMSRMIKSRSEFIPYLVVLILDNPHILCHTKSALKWKRLLIEI